ncbi:ATP-binding protein [Gilvimarinus sp. F26214L]|uniref:ATP-binding protein n=1 Tax=Gilvimarinus sp. DZF01 TaxID=3461371 RepID=UPI004045672F
MVDHRLGVLFVDDEEKARKYFARVFSDSYQVLSAESVDAAIELLEGHSANLAILVTDQRMPNRTGIDLVKYAKRYHPHVIRILTTAYADLSDAIDSVNEGEVYRYIRKPWDLAYLREEIRKATNLYVMREEERRIIFQKRQVMYQVASNIAHELRTPLTGIDVTADALDQDLDKLLAAYDTAEAANLALAPIEPARRGKLGRVVESIKAHVQRAHNIIDMLLVSAKPQNQCEDRRELISMATCVRQAVETYPMSDQQRSRIRIQAEDDFCFRGVQLLMVHVLYNLMKNAFHAISDTGRKGAIDIGLKRSDGRGVLVFRDNGRGISPDELPCVFDDFFSTKLESSNNGVGLPFCKRTLETWGASIQCTSTPGAYTEFTLIFPPALPGDSAETGANKFIS